MVPGVESRKALAARRVIEVLEYFDEHNRHATVMDIARRYNRPQSSTSELLTSLVGLGLLYKDPASRIYTLTPRAAILGSLSQPQLIRDGRLSMLIDNLCLETGLGTALIGTVGLNAQLFRWKQGAVRLGRTAGGLASGAQERLCDTAAGWLLLSTLPLQRREGMIRRLNAEAPDDLKFGHSEMSARVQGCGCQGYAIGPAGFGATAEMCAVLLPSETDERPMALSFIYEPTDQVDPMALVALLQKEVQGCLDLPTNEVRTLRLVADAA